MKVADPQVEHALPSLHADGSSSQQRCPGPPHASQSGLVTGFPAQASPESRHAAPLGQQCWLRPPQGWHVIAVAPLGRHIKGKAHGGDPPQHGRF
jgi:hypothetical protein